MSKRSFLLEVSYPGSDIVAQVDEAIIKAARREPDGSGSRFGQRYIQFTFKSEAAANNAKHRIEALVGFPKKVSVYHD